ncbi:MAG: sporulation protein YtfJ [Ruminococcaceae bacterium]|nr:sporulation protein YtfJ [Oscillospiraceae bacterium]
MAEHPIKGLMETAMKSIKDMVDVNTIVGNPVETPDGTVIIPLSKVSFGFASGGSEFGPKSQIAPEANSNFGGAAGGGASIEPIAFLVVGNGQIKLMPVDLMPSPYDGIIEKVPSLIDKFTEFIGKKRAKKRETIEVAETVEEITE